MRIANLINAALVSLFYMIVGVTGARVTTPTRTLVERWGSSYTCVSLSATVLAGFVNLYSSLCICLGDGQSMEDWVNSCEDQNVSHARSKLGTILLSAQLQALYEQYKCSYPPHAVPIQCHATCDFTCQAPYIKKNGKCVLPPSSGPYIRKRGGDTDTKNEKRGLFQVNEDFGGGSRMGGEEEDEDEDTSFETKCEWGLTKCGILNSEWKNQRQTFECVDANSSLDSCGGCVVPYASRSPGPLGVDCTSIVGVSDVECIRGACIVRRCAKGWDIQPVDVHGGGGNNNNPIAMECVPHQTREEMTRDVPSKISPQLFDDLKRAPDF